VGSRSARGPLLGVDGRRKSSRHGLQVHSRVKRHGFGRTSFADDATVPDVDLQEAQVILRGMFGTGNPLRKFLHMMTFASPAYSSFLDPASTVVLMWATRPAGSRPFFASLASFLGRLASAAFSATALSFLHRQWTETPAHKRKTCLFPLDDVQAHHPKELATFRILVHHGPAAALVGPEGIEHQYLAQYPGVPRLIHHGRDFS